ncbi:Transposase [Wolbachia endosymbiont of Cylisticus convexus]|nr:Transposase [Wolbachia endosymbiont of Cylisticus convexus]
MFYYKEIISKLPRKELEKIGEAVGVDYRVSKLTGENVFNLLLYSILEKNELSLRIIEENYRRMFNIDTRHSSVASRLKTIPVKYFEKIFSFVLQSSGKSTKVADNYTSAIK